MGRNKQWWRALAGNYASVINNFIYEKNALRIRIKELGVECDSLAELLEEVEKLAPAGRVDHEFTRFPDSWVYFHRRLGDPYPEYFSGIGETKSDAVAAALIEIVEGKQA